MESIKPENKVDLISLNSYKLNKMVMIENVSTFWISSDKPAFFQKNKHLF